MKIFTGKVVSTKMKNTATVLVDSTFMHRLYGKRFRTTKKYHVHDEYGSQIGDSVNFVASKPFSKIKKWKIIKIEDKRKATQNMQKKTASTDKSNIQKGKKEIEKTVKTINLVVDKKTERKGKSV